MMFEKEGAWQTAQAQEELTLGAILEANLTKLYDTGMGKGRAIRQARLIGPAPNRACGTVAFCSNVTMMGLKLGLGMPREVNGMRQWASAAFLLSHARRNVLLWGVTVTQAKALTLTSLGGAWRFEQ